MEKQITDEMLRQARIIISKIAQAHGVPESEVRTEMLKAMQAGMENPDPEVQKSWRKIPWRGPEPTAEELLAWTTLMVEREVDKERKTN